jgi:nondiscriminating glutamyl-tRNA synthetase
MTQAPLKTRFAPSPTGRLHLGNVRTALFNHLWARHNQGVFLLRIEDTDATRGEEHFTEALMVDLRWLGLQWDEGPDSNGPHAPYAQSQRGPLYETFAARLIEAGLAYPCFCTEHELKLERKTQIAAGQPPRYSGKCRVLSPQEVQMRRERGTPETLRFHVADGRTVEFEDRVRGPQRFATDDIGDFVIRRSDGTPAFFFCNAVDDALMGVTIVVRGDDHLTNTPRQILLLEALGLPVSDYAHIPLVVGAGGAPLSKRTGSKSLQELRDGGYLPTAINNYLARVGHTYEAQGLLSLDLLARDFELRRVHHSPARYDETQLLHWQREAVRAASGDELWRWMGEKVQRLVPADRKDAFVEGVRGNVVFPDEAADWAAIFFESEAIKFSDADAKHLVEQEDPQTFARFIEAMDEIGWNAHRFGKEFPFDHAPKSSFPRIRAALTGRTRGPEMWRILDLLGKARALPRLESAMEMSRKRLRHTRT